MLLAETSSLYWIKCAASLGAGENELNRGNSWNDMALVIFQKQRRIISK